MLVHTLTDEEVDLVKQIAYARNANKRSKNVTSAKVDNQQTESEIEVVGVGGEVAAAHALGMKVNQDLYTGGDDGWDVRLGKVTAEVKTRRRPKRDFAMYDAESDLEAMVGVLCWQSGRTYTIVGWLTRYDWQRWSEVLRFGSKRRKGVRYTKLRDAADLRSRLSVYADTLD